MFDRPTGSGRDGAPWTPARQQPEDQALEESLAAVRVAMARCVVASESFRLNGCLPNWVTDER